MGTRTDNPPSHRTASRVGVILVVALVSLAAQRAAAARAGLSADPAIVEATGRLDREPPREWFVELGGRYVNFPAFITGRVFGEHTAMHSYAVGAAALWRRPGAGEWRFALDYIRLGFAQGNWLEQSLPPASAVYLEWDIGVLAVSAGYVWRWTLLEDRLMAVVGAGGGLGVVIGDIYATDVLPTCQEPVTECTHWRWATRRKVDLPSRALPIPIVQLGLDLRVVADFWLRLEGGIYGLPYAGLSAALRVW